MDSVVPCDRPLLCKTVPPARTVGTIHLTLFNTGIAAAVAQAPPGGAAQIGPGSMAPGGRRSAALLALARANRNFRGCCDGYREDGIATGRDLISSGRPGIQA